MFNNLRFLIFAVVIDSDALDTKIMIAPIADRPAAGGDGCQLGGEAEEAEGDGPAGRQHLGLG